jgi:transcriptional regulator of heat shock response
MPRLTDSESRRKDILLATIELYLKMASPVSSDSLHKMRKTNLSSASVRNVFSDLEDVGFLTHPHTSACRIPTDEGYRFYINALMRKKKLNSEEVNFIDMIYELKVEELDDLLVETSRIMSDFTHYTSFVSFWDEDDERTYFQGVRYILEHPEFTDTRKAHMILEALERKETLIDLINRNFSDQTKVYIGKECDCPQMESCSVIVSQYTGKGNRRGRLALIGPKRMAYDEVIPLMDYISQVMTKNIEKFRG